MRTVRIEQLLDELRRLAREPWVSQEPYLVPRFVVEPDAGTDLIDVGNPYVFYGDVVAGIMDLASDGALDDGPAHHRFDETDVVYLSFVRTAAAFNGRIGTALSQLALAP